MERSRLPARPRRARRPRPPVVALGVLALFAGLPACEQPDYTGASFKPVEGPSRSARLVLHIFRPGGREIPWGDAALYHRRSPASKDAVPVEFEASLTPGARHLSGEDGSLDLSLAPGTYGLELGLGERRVLRRLELAPEELSVSLWSVEGDRDAPRVLGLAATFPHTELLSGPVSELARLLPRIRDHLRALGWALEEGEAEDLRRILAEDFRDPLGGRVDFMRAALHRRRTGAPLRLVGDAWAVRAGENLRVHLALSRDGLRTFPTLELVEDRAGPGGFRVRTLY